MISSREAILDRIKAALKTPSEISVFDGNIDEKINKGINSVTPKELRPLWSQFENELTAIAGEFHSVKNVNEAADVVAMFMNESRFQRIGISKEAICSEVARVVQTKFSEIEIIYPDKLGYEERKKEYSITEVAIVHPAFAVADIASLVFLYDQTGTTYPHFLCDNTFAVVYESQIVANQFDLFGKIDRVQAKNMVFVTGPSRTADIEKVLVLGAHGPRKLVVLRIEE